MSDALTCPNCSEVVPADNVNEDRLVAICPTCDHIFKFNVAGQVVPTKIEGSAPEKPKSKQKGKPVAAHPSRSLEVEDDMHTGGVIIRRRYGKGAQLGFLTFFTIFWNGFLVLWFWSAFASGAYSFAMFGSLHLAVGIGLAYYVLATRFNVTTLTADAQQVRVMTTPIFRHVPREFEAGNIEQVFVKRLNGKSNQYHVMVQTASDAEPQLLLHNVHSYQDALFVEQEVERLMGIVDERVPGEAVRQEYY
ncbi:MAG: hypothetical protein AAF125_02770 [Chloroflexota bacterium]